MTTAAFIWNELHRMGFEWSADLDDRVSHELEAADGRDTARYIARKIAKNPAADAWS